MIDPYEYIHDLIAETDKIAGKLSTQTTDSPSAVKSAIWPLMLAGYSNDGVAFIFNKVCVPPDVPNEIVAMIARNKPREEDLREMWKEWDEANE